VVRPIGAWQRRIARARGLRAPRTGAVVFTRSLSPRTRGRRQDRWIVRHNLQVRRSRDRLVQIIRYVPITGLIARLLLKAVNRTQARAGSVLAICERMVEVRAGDGAECLGR